MNKKNNAAFDLIIIGSGVGSIAAALIAKDNGLKPLIIEKSDKVGGTTAYSGGVAWIPNNPIMARAGIADSFDRAKQYINAAVWHKGPAASDARINAFLQHAPALVEYLESKGMVFLRPTFWPDYHSDVAGGEQTSRCIMAELFDINQLGEWKQHFQAIDRPALRFHIEEASQLALVTRSWKSRWLAVKFAGRLLKNKLLGQDIRGAGAALQGRLLQIALREQIPIWRSTAVTELLQDNNRVSGIKAIQHGQVINVYANKGVLINAGGFAHNTAMREQYGRQPVYTQFTATAANDQGDLIQAAMNIGAQTDCLDEGLWGVSSLSATGKFPGGEIANYSSGLPIGHHFDISLPHCIMVDQDGQRFTNEAGSYMCVGQDLYQRHAQTGKGIPAWAIIESRHRKRYPWGMHLGKTPQIWLDSGYMKQASTLEVLAEQCGINTNGLHDSVARFNQFCKHGVDEDYQRGGKAFDRCHGDPTVKPNPNLGEINQAPFYAVAIYPGDVSTYGGLVTDQHARVLNTNGDIINGLYATGTSTASVFGRTYTGAGASIGPAMTFGYIAALHACQTPIKQPAK